MREPATTPAGITYERAALMRWLEHRHAEPSTKQRLKRSRVVPNLALRAMIEDWLDRERRRRVADVRAGIEREKNNLRRGEVVSKSAAREIGGNKGKSPEAAAATARGSGGGGLGDDAESRASRSNHHLHTHHGGGGGASRGAGSLVDPAERDSLRAARREMYAALKARAAVGESPEERRWAHVKRTRERGGEGEGAAAASAEASASASATFEGVRESTGPPPANVRREAGESSTRRAEEARVPRDADGEASTTPSGEASTAPSAEASAAPHSAPFSGPASPPRDAADADDDAFSALDTTVPDADDVEDDA